MPKFTFKPADLKKGFALAKIVKPETGDGASSLGDFHLRFTDSNLIIFSTDRRRFTRIQVRPDSVDNVSPGYQSDEFYLMRDRVSLFDSGLDNITISVNEKSLSITASGGGEMRQATLKKRSTSARRLPIPDPPTSTSSSAILHSKHFEELLRQVSCSALIKETKSDEARRINQVHFYPDKGCAASNARYYLSMAFLPDLNLDLSIVSDDLPLARAFCATCASEHIELSQDTNRMYLTDRSTGSFIALTKLAAAKPPLSLLDSEGFSTVVEVDREVLVNSLQWASMTIEGTQRMGFNAEVVGDAGEARVSSGSQELSKFPVRFVKGATLKADFPVKFFASIAGYLESGTVVLRFGHPKIPTLLEVSQPDPENPVRAMHYLQSMVVHS